MARDDGGMVGGGGRRRGMAKEIGRVEEREANGKLEREKKEDGEEAGESDEREDGRRLHECENECKRSGESGGPGVSNEKDGCMHEECIFSLSSEH